MNYKIILFLIVLVCFKTSFSQDTLYIEDFESKTEESISIGGVQDWKLIINTGSSNLWNFTDDDPLNGSISLSVDDDITSSSNNTYTNSDDCDKIVYYTTQINASNYYNLEISYKWRCEGEETSGTDYDYGKLIYSTDETNWVDLSNELNLQSTSQSELRFDISSLDNSLFYIGFRWINDGSVGTNPPLSVDDILITGLAPVSCSPITYPENGAREISQTPIIIWDKEDNAEGYKVYIGTDNPPTNIINGTTTPSTAYYVNSTLTANTLHYVKIVPYNNGGDASGCSTFSFTTIDPTVYTEWDGSSSSDWNTAGNWSNGVPDQSKSVIIPSVAPGDNQPTITSNASVNNITFETGGVLNINDAVTLSVYGEWSNYFGTLKGNSGIVEFKGTGTSLTAYSTPSYEIDGLETTGSTSTSTLTGSGDYRGGIAITPDSIYITGDAGTIRMHADDFSGRTTLTDHRDAFFSDLLTGKLYTLWDTNTSTDPDCLCNDNSTGTADTEDCLETFEFNSLQELNTDLSTSGNIIPLVDIDGNSYSITCKGGQKYVSATSTTWTYRTGIFPGYGFLLLFADNDYGDERMYAIDIQSGEVDSLGYKNITPELEVSEGYANWGFGEYDGSDYYLIYKMKDEDKLRRVNLTTMETSDYIDFSGTDGLAYMSSISFSPWKSSWYFYLQGSSEFDNTLTATEELVGYATGSNKITVNEGLPEILTNVTINKTNSTDVLTLSSPLTVRDLTIIQGEVDISTDNHKITIKGDLDIQSNGDLTVRNGDIEFGGLADQNLTASSLAFYDITLNKATGTLVLNNDMNISNSLALTSGIINAGSYKVDLSSNASSALTGGSSSSFVYGNLERAITSNTDTYSFPVGSGTTSNDYYQLDFINNNLADVSDLNVEVNSITESGNNVDSEIATNEGNGNNYNNVLNDAIWEITPTGTASGGNYGIDLHFGNMSGSLTDNLFGILKRPSGSTSYADWDSFHSSTTTPADDANGRTVSSGYAQRTGFTSFSEFGIGITEFTLPVEWVDFNGYASNGNNILRWTTATEINNDFFQIERSKDGILFETIGSVNGKGNYNGISHYVYTDSSVNKNTLFYRIKQVDYNGDYDYSKIISVQNYELKQTVFMNYNSSANNLMVNVGDAKDMNWQLLIIDYSGKIVHNNKLNSTRDEQFINFHLPSLNRGLYLINLKSSAGSYTQRMLID